jgi:hypothetical protein
MAEDFELSLLRELGVSAERICQAVCARQEAQHEQRPSRIAMTNPGESGYSSF